MRRRASGVEFAQRQVRPSKLTVPEEVDAGENERKLPIKTDESQTSASPEKQEAVSHAEE
jgi:hypothetical protein